MLAYSHVCRRLQVSRKILSHPGLSRRIWLCGLARVSHGYMCIHINAYIYFYKLHISLLYMCLCIIYMSIIYIYICNIICISVIYNIYPNSKGDGVEQAEAPFQWHRRRNTFSGSGKRDMDLGMASQGVRFSFFCGPLDARCSFFIFFVDLRRNGIRRC